MTGDAILRQQIGAERLYSELAHGVEVEFDGCSVLRRVTFQEGTRQLAGVEQDVVKYPAPRVGMESSNVIQRPSIRATPRAGSSDCR